MINISDVWNEETIAKHEKYGNKILFKINKNKDRTKNQIFDYMVSKYFQKLISGDPHVLREVVNEVEAMRLSNFDKDQGFVQLCKKYFDYDKFSKKKLKSWCAYRLCDSSIYKMCPYCQENEAKTMIINNNLMAYRPPLDHYYDKDTYPYLAISIKNLVPSCYICNTSLKATKNFFRTPHLHPYESDEIISFEWDVYNYLKSRSVMSNDFESLGIRIKKINPGNLEYLHWKNSISTFLILDRIKNNYKEIKRYIDVLELDRSSIKERVKLFQDGLNDNSFCISEESLLQFDIRDYKNEKLGLLKKNLYEIAKSI